MIENHQDLQQGWYKTLYPTLHLPQYTQDRTYPRQRALPLPRTFIPHPPCHHPSPSVPAALMEPTVRRQQRGWCQTLYPTYSPLWCAWRFSLPLQRALPPISTVFSGLLATTPLLLTLAALPKPAVRHLRWRQRRELHPKLQSTQFTQHRTHPWQSALPPHHTVILYPHRHCHYPFRIQWGSQNLLVTTGHCHCPFRI